MAARDQFDFLVSDVGLPDGSGVDLMRALRLRGDMLPGIAVSGFGHAGDVESTRAAGFLAHLVKPVDPERLLEALEANTAT
jgi:CheY-like chemotaxis protein